MCLCSPQHNRQGGSDYVDALCALLLLQALPSSALWGIGWLLLQVFGLGKAGQYSHFEPHVILILMALGIFFGLVPSLHSL